MGKSLPVLQMLCPQIKGPYFAFYALSHLSPSLLPSLPPSFHVFIYFSILLHFLHAA